MHKIWSHLFMNCLLIWCLPMVADAAGTYYTGAAYQPVQYQYGQTGSYTANGYNRTGYVSPVNSMASVRYNNARSVNVGQQKTNITESNQRVSQQTSRTSTKTSSGFFANAGISRENAMWNFEMTNVANSVLHYDNLAWNVLDLNAGYVFNLGNAKMQVDAGFKYGLQWGETTMIDDDISNGGYSPVDLVDDNDRVVGQMIGHALSVGASKDGNMLGFNVGLGLKDVFKVGNVKITPSIGYRYLKYKLETKNNYGLAVASGACFPIADGEIQCDPAIWGIYVVGTQEHSQLFWRDNLDTLPSAVFDEEGHQYYTQYIDYGDTYYYTQAGTSHSYEATWAGPYIAMDMLYDINQYNSVNGRIELGFPGYASVGDQPYRWDWSHPKSVEDSAGMFSAFHLGMGANWKTAITDNVAFSLGVTYDYYTVSGAEAKTYLNETLYKQLLAKFNNDEDALLDPSTGSPQAIYINNERKSCGGWICRSNKEIDSIYKSMGIRIGIDARF